MLEYGSPETAGLVDMVAWRVQVGQIPSKNLKSIRDDIDAFSALLSGDEIQCSMLFSVAP